MYINRTNEYECALAALAGASSSEVAATTPERSWGAGVQGNSFARKSARTQHWWFYYEHTSYNYYYILL